MNEVSTDFGLKFPRASLDGAVSGQIKTTTNDFYVEEMMNPDLSGEGEHVWLWIEKDGQNTDYVAGRLARFAQVKKMDVGISGLKDRWAVTRQWFSVYLGNKPEPDWEAFNCEGTKVLRFSRHNKKLRRGEHGANLFRIVVRDLENTEALSSKLEVVKAKGFPNYFGPQRFGFNGANLDRGALFFDGKIKASKSQRSFYLSAARSFLFNLNLARCIGDESWLTLPEGGPLYGDEKPGEAELTTEERAILEKYPAFKKGIHQNRLRLERRPYVVVPKSLSWQIEANTVKLEFELPTGVFATSLLSEVFELTQGLGEGNEGLRSTK